MGFFLLFFLFYGILIFNVFFWGGGCNDFVLPPAAAALRSRRAFELTEPGEIATGITTPRQDFYGISSLSDATLTHIRQRRGT